MGVGERRLTCNLKRPEPQVLFDRIKNQFQATVLNGGTVIPESTEWYVVANQYASEEALYSIAEQQWRERDPRQACCDNLISIAALDGVFPRPATFAKGYVKISGTAGSAVPSSLVVSFNDKNYKTDVGATVPPVIPTQGFIVVRMVAEIPGPETASSSVSTGKLITQSAGLSNTVEIYGGQFCGGQAAEDCETFRTRYLARKQYQPKANFEWVKAKLLEWPCVTRVCIRDCSCCPERGTLDLFVFFDGTFPYGIPPTNVLTDLENWYFGSPQGFGFGQAEWGQTGKFYAPTPIPVNIKVTDLPCSSSAQVEDIKQRITRMFDNLCPGKAICRRMIDAIIIQVLGPTCDFNVVMEPVGTGSQFCDDFNPLCDELPVAGTITVGGVL
jgi:uncharacterized phage protein gp47/JayE